MSNFIPSGGGGHSGWRASLQQVGGNLAEILTTIATLIRERQKLAGTVRVLAGGAIAAFGLFGIAKAWHPAAMAGPLCVNLVTHSSNACLEGKLRIVARYRPPILVSALGSPRRANQSDAHMHPDRLGDAHRHPQWRRKPPAG